MNRRTEAIWWAKPNLLWEGWHLPICTRSSSVSATRLSRGGGPETIIYGHRSDEHQNPRKIKVFNGHSRRGFWPGESVRVGLSLNKDSQKRECILRIGTSKPVFQPPERPASFNRHAKETISRRDLPRRRTYRTMIRIGAPAGTLRAAKPDLVLRFLGTVVIRAPLS